MRCMNIVNKKFNRLTVIERTVNDKCGKSMWLCKCDCGKISKVAGSNLKSGAVKSCGCLMKELLIKASVTHGNRRIGINGQTYSVWGNMLQRCTNVKNKSYKDYGGRGIKVCDEWRYFVNFLKDMGNKPERLTLDRINVNGNYCKDNCKWSTSKEQNNNTRSNIFIDYNGKTQTVKQWSEELNIKYYTLISRIKRGWCIEKALTRNRNVI